MEKEIIDMIKQEKQEFGIGEIVNNTRAIDEKLSFIAWILTFILTVTIVIMLMTLL